jgi:hypothetical protein
VFIDGNRVILEIETLIKFAGEGRMGTALWKHQHKISNKEISLSS